MIFLTICIIVLQDNEEDNELRYAEFSTDNPANIEDKSFMNNLIIVVLQSALFVVFQL